MRNFWGIITAGLAVVFAVGFAIDYSWLWLPCYVSAILMSCSYIWFARRNFLSLTCIFISLSLIAITFPAVPYFYYGYEASRYFNDSIYMNTVGYLFFISIAFFAAPVNALVSQSKLTFTGQDWRAFFDASKIIQFISLPFVIVSIALVGAWGVLSGNIDSHYDRIAAMKGMGPLMIFSVLNIMSLFFLTLNEWLNNRKFRAIMLSIMILYINSFTQGRQNFIFFLFAALLVAAIRNGVSRLTGLYAFFFGIAIVLMKIARTVFDPDADQLPFMLTFFLHFVGDFDSLNNDAVLIDDTRVHGFFGFYHIWSNILVYIPRFLFPDKPHDIGSLYVNSYIFPGVYLGAEGGTGLSLGFQGIWYAAYGLPTLIGGNVLLAGILCALDRRFARALQENVPTFVFVSYIFLMGQAIILYRDGFYAFLNTALYASLYYAVFMVVRMRRG